VRFASDAEESKIVSTIQDSVEDQTELQMFNDTTFEFDPDISPENRFVQFKASNIGRVLNLGPGDEEESEDELDEGSV